eukprot:GHVL01035520.1.p2 GENE.GHVL01035520.1~~GHVL01035520.1.p2  ORF type:complete len:113 (+),score=15.23 GHVL01035520.1:120-458(+)
MISIFHLFKKRYLFGYFIMVTGDWLQGPYLFVLYKEYGYNTQIIGFFFIIGFLCSAIFGIIIGYLADIFGSKNMCILYGFLYSIGCVTQSFSNFYILLNRLAEFLEVLVLRF